MLFPRGIMARNYKMLTQHHKESVNATGGWLLVAYWEKDTPNTSGKGYLDRATINFLVDDVDGSDSLRPIPFGFMFALSNKNSLETVDGDANQLHPAYMLDVGCRDGGAGSITLSARRQIAENAVDTTEGDGYIYLWAKNTDLTNDDNVIVRYYIETYGRWVKCIDA
jgi:hypothetical protein|tara:strand:+ start:97 stop:597 length:501 start_codon:yes stop_codon:yes gene_type:complete